MSETQEPCRRIALQTIRYPRFSPVCLRHAARCLGPHLGRQSIALFLAFISLTPHLLVFAADIQIDGSTKTRIYNTTAGNALFNADGSMVTNSVQQTSTTGNSVVITTGTRAGSNAFNSFSTFNVLSGKSVNLILPKGTTTLVNRVTGPASSTIAGRLESNIFDTSGNRVIGGHVILLNPYGLLFSSSAQVNVGALTATSATGIRFSDGIMGVSPLQNIDDSPFTGVLQRYIFNIANNQRAAAVRTAGNSQITATGDINLLGGSINSAGILNAGGHINLVAVDNVDSLGQRSAYEVDLNDLSTRFDAGNISSRVTGTATLSATQQQLNSDLVNYDLIVAGGLPEATRVTYSGTKVLLSTDGNVALAGSVNADTVALSTTGDVNVTGLKANLDGASAPSAETPNGARGKNLSLYAANGTVKSVSMVLKNNGGASFLGAEGAKGGQGGNLFMGGHVITIQNTNIKGNGGVTQSNGYGGTGGSVLVSATGDVNLNGAGTNNWHTWGGDGGYNNGLGGRIFVAGNNIYGDGVNNSMDALGAGELAIGDFASYQRIEMNAAHILRLGNTTDRYYTYQLRAQGTALNPSALATRQLSDGNAIDLSADNLQLNWVLTDTSGVSAIAGSNQAGGVGGTQHLTANQISIFSSNFFSLGGRTYNTAARGFAAYDSKGYGIDIKGADSVKLNDVSVLINGGWSAAGAAKGGSLHVGGKSLLIDNLLVTANGGQGVAVGSAAGNGSDGGTILLDNYHNLSLTNSSLQARGWSGASGGFLSDGSSFAPGRSGNGGTISLLPTLGDSTSITALRNSTLSVAAERAGSMTVKSTDTPSSPLANGGAAGSGGILQIGNAGLPQGTITMGADADSHMILNASGGDGGNGAGMDNISDQSGLKTASNGGQGGAGGTIVINGAVIALNAKSELYAEGGNGGKGGGISLTQESNLNSIHAGAGGSGGNGGSITLNGANTINLGADTTTSPTTTSNTNFTALLASAQAGTLTKIGTDGLVTTASLLDALSKLYKGALLSSNGGDGGNYGKVTLPVSGSTVPTVVATGTAGNGGIGGGITLASQNTLGIESSLLQATDGMKLGSLGYSQATGSHGGSISVSGKATTVSNSFVMAQGGQSSAAAGYGIDISGIDSLNMNNDDLLSTGRLGANSNIAQGGSIHLSGITQTLSNLYLDVSGNAGIALSNTPAPGANAGSITLDNYQSLNINNSTLQAMGSNGQDAAIQSDGSLSGPGNGGNGGIIKLLPTGLTSSGNTLIQNSALLAGGGKGGNMATVTSSLPVTPLPAGAVGGNGGLIQIGNTSNALTGLKGTLILTADATHFVKADASGGKGGNGGSLLNLDIDNASVTKATSGGQGGQGGNISLNGDTINLNNHAQLSSNGGSGGQGGDMGIVLSITSAQKDKARHDSDAESNPILAGAGGAGGKGGAISIYGNTGITLNADTTGTMASSLSQADLDTALNGARSGKTNLLGTLGETVKASLIMANGGQGGDAGNMVQVDLKNKHSVSVEGAQGGSGGQGGTIALQSQAALEMNGNFTQTPEGSLSGSVSIIEALGGNGGRGSQISNTINKSWLARTGDGGGGGNGGAISLGTQTGTMDLHGWIIGDGGNGGNAGGYVENAPDNNGNHFGSLQIGRGGNGGNGGAIQLSTTSGAINFGGIDTMSTTPPPPAYSVITVNGGAGGSSPLFTGSAKQAASKGYAGKGGNGGKITVISGTKRLADAFKISDNQIFSARGGNGGNRDLSLLSNSTLADVSQYLLGVNLNSKSNGLQSLLLGGKTQRFSLMESTNGPYTGTTDATVQSSISVVSGEGDGSNSDYTGGAGGSIEFIAPAP